MPGLFVNKFRGKIQTHTNTSTHFVGNVGLGQMLTSVQLETLDRAHLLQQAQLNLISSANHQTRRVDSQELISHCYWHGSKNGVSCREQEGNERNKCTIVLLTSGPANEQHAAFALNSKSTSTPSFLYNRFALVQATLSCQ